MDNDYFAPFIIVQVLPFGTAKMILLKNCDRLALSLN